MELNVGNWVAFHWTGAPVQPRGARKKVQKGNVAKADSVDLAQASLETI
jgi:hypothetical protein